MSLSRQFRQPEPVKAVAAPTIHFENGPVTIRGVMAGEGTLPPRKRGPTPSGNAKKLLTLRLDIAVIEKFKATGPGWQARMNEALKAAKV